MSQKVLVVDVETAPLIAYVWDRKDVNIALNQIKEDWYVIAWAAKWFGHKKIFYMDNRKVWQSQDDKELLRNLWDLINEADILITQNGKNFDLPKLNARFILNGFPPPSPVRHLDTYKIARSTFGFTSNKLEYLTDKLNKRYKKLLHSKFPGMELWKECLKGNQAAWKEMEKYNKHDVLSTEELYETLKAWAPETAPHMYTEKNTCGVCGKGPVWSNGYRICGSKVYRRLLCAACGHWSKGPVVS